MPTRSLIRRPTLAPSHYAYLTMLTTYYAYHSSCLPHKSITRRFDRTLGYVKTEVRSIIRTSTRSILIYTHGRFLTPLKLLPFGIGQLLPTNKNFNDS